MTSQVYFILWWYTLLGDESLIFYLDELETFSWHYKPLSSKNREASWSIKMTMISLKVRLWISISSDIFIFQSFSLEYNSFFSRKYMLKHHKVSEFLKWNILQVLGRHQPHWSRKIDQIVKTKRLTDYSRYKPYSKLFGFIRTTITTRRILIFF